jgi:hypothetical protein
MYSFVVSNLRFHQTSICHNPARLLHYAQTGRRSSITMASIGCKHVPKGHSCKEEVIARRPSVHFTVENLHVRRVCILQAALYLTTRANIFHSQYFWLQTSHAIWLDAELHCPSKVLPKTPSESILFRANPSPDDNPQLSFYPQ